MNCEECHSGGSYGTFGSKNQGALLSIEVTEGAPFWEEGVWSEARLINHVEAEPMAECENQWSPTSGFLREGDRNLKHLPETCIRLGKTYGFCPKREK